MPRARPPHLQREKTRHGRIVWVHRIGKGSRTRIRGEYGSDAFWAAYDAAERGDEPVASAQRGKANPKSLRWLIDRYKDSGSWSALSPETRKQRDNIFSNVIKKAGNTPYVQITKAVIAASIDARKKTPHAAKHFRQAMRHMFKWALSAQHVEADPTEGVELPKRKKTGGYKAWTPEWCAAYEKRWPPGTRERVWYEVIHETGLRRGDAVRFGRQHIRLVKVKIAGKIVKQRRAMVRTEKTNETAYFLVSDRLWDAIKAGPTGDLTFIVGDRNTALKKESFGNYFREACRAAGVAGSAHGIRKTRSISVAETGVSGAALNAMLGWGTGSNTSAIYIDNANRARLAYGDGEEIEPTANVYTRTHGSGAGIKSKKSV